MLAAGIRQAEAFPEGEWRVFGVASPVLIAAQTAIFFAPEPMKQPLDLFCYGLLFALAALLLIRAVRSLRSGRVRARRDRRAFRRLSGAAGTLMLLLVLVFGLFHGGGTASGGSLYGAFLLSREAGAMCSWR